MKPRQDKNWLDGGGGQSSSVQCGTDSGCRMLPRLSVYAPASRLFGGLDSTPGAGNMRLSRRLPKTAAVCTRPFEKSVDGQLFSRSAASDWTHKLELRLRPVRGRLQPLGPLTRANIWPRMPRMPSQSRPVSPHSGFLLRSAQASWLPPRMHSQQRPAPSTTGQANLDAINPPHHQSTINRPGSGPPGSHFC